jgi:hypothetical protein
MCHDHRHHRTVRVARDVRAEDFRRRPDLRASDAEREAVVARLREHGAAGRLDVDELEERIGAAYAARTHGELARLFDDLPNVRPVEAMRGQPRRPVQPGQRRLSDELRVFAGVNILLVAIWLFAGAGYFWPVWVMIWWGVALALKLPLRHRATHHGFHTPPGAG